MSPGFQISEEEARRLIKELGKMGLIYFSFSGGEPLLVPYCFDLLAYAKKCGILYTHIVSNGYLMDVARAKKLAEAHVSEISFSLDGDEKVHDQNRGMKGAFNKVIEVIDHVKTHAPKTEIVLNTILNPIQPENAIFALNLAKRLGVKIKVQPINDHPSFGANEPALKQRRSLQDNEKQRLLETIELIQKSSHAVNSKPFLENFKAFMFYPENLAFASEVCILGYHHIEIFANQIFPCLEGLMWKEGFDLSKSSIKDTINSPLYQNKLKELKKCPHCRKNYYICYYELRLNFPFTNLIKSRIKIPKIKPATKGKG